MAYSISTVYLLIFIYKRQMTSAAVLAKETELRKSIEAKELGAGSAREKLQETLNVLVQNISSAASSSGEMIICFDTFFLR